MLDDGVVSQSEVRELLKRNYLDVSRFKIVGQNVKIHLKKTEISKDILIEAIKAHMKKNYPNVVVQKVSMRYQPLGVIGNYSIKVEPETVSSNYAYVRITIYDNQKEPKKTVRAYLHLQTFGFAVVAGRDIPKGKIITDKDIALQRVQMRNSRSFLTKDEIVGHVAKINIYKGKKITKYMITPNYSVHKRQLVKILYSKGPIHIELLGIALQNGKSGDIIRVKNLSSNKVLVCKVLSNGVVQFLY